MPSLALAFPITAVDKGASRTLDRLGDKVDSTGKKLQRLGGRGAGVASKLTALAGVGGVGALIGSSVKLAASFETTMRQVAVATGAGEGALKSLNATALKMGADTTFSAQQAGDAMLELAKSGMTQAEIKAGALKQTLTLAAAGGLELGEAAGYVTTGLSIFGLKADKASRVTAALAGAANATKASVSDVGYSLAQAGAAASDAGFNIEETAAAIAIMGKYGRLGSDAGTALKVMFSRLVPQTGKAAEVMKDLGLKFTDANGDFVSLAEVAQQLHDKVGPLTKAERTLALTTLFGQDARGAAINLMKEGAKGVRDMTIKTSDLTAAQKLADAATSGTGGALEQMRGSIETAQIALGTALAPAVVDVAKKVSAFASGPLTKDIIPAIGSFVRGMENGTGPGGQFADVVGELGDAAKGAWSAAKPLFGFIGDHPKLFGEVAKDAVIFAAALKGISTIKKLPGLGSLLGGGAGKGGLLGSITKAAPLPVFVTNPGFGGGPDVDLPGKGGKGKVPVTPIAARGVALGIGSVLLTSGDQGPLIGRQKEWHDFVVNLKKLIEVERGTSKEANEQARLLGKAFNKGGRTDLVAVYDLLTKYGKKTGEVKQKIAELAKDPAVARALRERAEQAKRNVELITGGFLSAEQVAKASSQRMGLSIGNGVGKGVRYALDRTDNLGTHLDKLGAKRPRPVVKLDDKEARADVWSLLQSLKKLDGKTWNTTVDVKIRTDNDLPLPVGRRAMGGPVVKNGMYVVGEREPEVFVPNTNGRILNQKQLQAALAGSGGGTTVTMTNYITTATPEAALSVPDQLRQSLWLKGL